MRSIFESRPSRRSPSVTSTTLASLKMLLSSWMRVCGADGGVVAVDEVAERLAEAALVLHEVIEEVELADDAAVALVLVEDRELADAVLLEDLDRLAHGGGLAGGDHAAGLAAQDVGDGPADVVLVEEAVAAHPLVVEDLAEVLLRAVGEQHQDPLGLLEGAGVLDGADDGGAARAAGEDALAADQVAGHDEALAVVDLDDVVEDVEVHGRLGRKSSPMPST
jgi:hypothetical protein